MSQNIKGINGALSLEIETFTIVPSTKNKTQPISNTEFQRRIDETKNKVRSLFGGSTEVEGKGEYQLKGKYLPEKVAIVYSFAQRDRFLKKKSEWISWIKSRKKAYGQDSMGVGIENDMYYV